MLKSMEKSSNTYPGSSGYVGGIWLANNSSVSERTKHVDLRAHFVRDMIEDQVMK